MSRLPIVLLGLFCSTAALAQTGPKPATPATIATQREIAAALPSDDGTDEEFAGRGFIATRSDPIIRSEDGTPVWNLASYAFVEGEAPPTVNPSLWRHVRVLKRHGLFEVTDGLWQVRGFDLGNLTVIRGKTGWILIDPLTNVETARAALELVNDTLGERPVVAVIYSHSHPDHFAGVRGVIDEADVKAGKVKVFAPEGFMEETVSESVIARGAMTRRAAYQFGAGILPGPQGQMGGGIGVAVGSGRLSLIAPTDIVTHTGETLEVDGVQLEFQIVSGSEAPAELNVLLPAQRTFLSSEMSTCTMHNILTPRGAKVRDTKLWAEFLDEAARDFAPRSDQLISSHCWPHFGTENAVSFLEGQRDNYRFLHDQTVRLMNNGQTLGEIAEDIVLPPRLAATWSSHGYYGTYSHNSKAIYQFYLGWYDAVPANLNPHPPVERAKKTTDAMGGSERVLALARNAFAEGDYRWSSDLLQQLVFADPGIDDARLLLADSYEQQGYQSESAIWRNQFLVAALELRNGPTIQFNAANSELVSAVPTAMLLDLIATRYIPAKDAGGSRSIGLIIPDFEEAATLETNGVTLIGRMGKGEADVTLTGPRNLILGLFLQGLPLPALEAAGLKVEGDREALVSLLAAIDPPQPSFPIVTP